MDDHGREDGAVPIPQILWQSSDGMMVIDETRQVLAMNQALRELTGCGSKDVIGRSEPPHQKFWCGGECGDLLGCRDLHGCPLAEVPGAESHGPDEAGRPKLGLAVSFEEDLVMLAAAPEA